MDAPGDIENMIEVREGWQKLAPAQGDIDQTFVDLFDCKAEYSAAYLEPLMLKAAPAWEAVPDAEEWLNEVRGSTLS